jgi:hypothetical protein
MQISALQQDVQSAAVAPPGYWKKMLDERDQELIGLEAQEAQTEIKMNQQISADLNRMSADLDAQRDKKIADVRQDQENRQNALLKSESDLLTAQRTDIARNYNCRPDRRQQSPARRSAERGVEQIDGACGTG